MNIQLNLNRLFNFEHVFLGENSLQKEARDLLEEDTRDVSPAASLFFSAAIADTDEMLNNSRIIPVNTFNYSA